MFDLLAPPPARGERRKVLRFRKTKDAGIVVQGAREVQVTCWDDADKVPPTPSLDTGITTCLFSFFLSFFFFFGGGGCVIPTCGIS